MDKKEKEERYKILLKNAIEAQQNKEKYGLKTSKTPLEQALEQQKERAKERHNYLLRDYDV